MCPNQPWLFPKVVFCFFDNVENCKPLIQKNKPAATLGRGQHLNWNQAKMAREWSPKKATDSLLRLTGFSFWSRLTFLVGCDSVSALSALVSLVESLVVFTFFCAASSWAHAVNPACSAAFLGSDIIARGVENIWEVQYTTILGNDGWISNSSVDQGLSQW